MNNDVTDNSSGPAGQCGYPLDNNAAGGADVLRCLSDILDPDTIEVIRHLGIAQGWRCLELGAGSGTIAGWLATQVGPSGLVMAVDKNPVDLRDGIALRVLKRDLITDPLPPGPFDLIHSRLTFAHLPNRVDLLNKAVGLLKPGGHLVIEDWGKPNPAMMYRSVDP